MQAIALCQVKMVYAGLKLNCGQSTLVVQPFQLIVGGFKMNFDSLQLIVGSCLPAFVSPLLIFGSL
jgi:hypothetical protein